MQPPELLQAPWFLRARKPIPPKGQPPPPQLLLQARRALPPELLPQSEFLESPSSTAACGASSVCATASTGGTAISAGAAAASGTAGSSSRHGFYRLRHSGRYCCGDFVVVQPGGALESAAQLPKTFAAADISTARMNVFQLRGKLRRAAVVAGTQHEIQQFFQRRCVRGSAAQDRFKQADGFLRQSVAGEQVHIGQRLRDELLRVFVQFRFRVRAFRRFRRDSAFSPARGPAGFSVLPLSAVPAADLR